MKAQTYSSCLRLKGRKLLWHSQKGNEVDRSVIDEDVVVLGSIDKGQAGLTDTIDMKARTMLDPPCPTCNPNNLILFLCSL